MPNQFMLLGVGYEATGADNTGVNDSRAAIQAAIDEANVNGGGTVYLDSGTYLVGPGGAAASLGALRMKSNTRLCGAGRGITIIKMAPNQAHDVTGVIRTPSGEETVNVCVMNLTIDGNKDNQADLTLPAVTGLVHTAGVATMTFASSVAAIFATDDEIYVYGANQAGYNTYKKITGVAGSTITFAVDAATVSPATGTITVGRAIDGFFCGVTPGQTDTDTNIQLRDVECKNMTRYGLDPHEQTEDFYAENCISHDNGLDGLTVDFITNGLIDNYVGHSNGRHGLNIVTTSSRITVTGGELFSNGSNGLACNGTSGNRVGKIDVFGMHIHENLRENVVIRKCDYINIIGGSNELAARDGIDIKGSRYCTVDNVKFINNGSATNATYADIVLEEEDGSTPATRNSIGGGNTFEATAANKVKYHVEETDDSTDINEITLGIHTGAVTKPVLLTGASSSLQYKTKNAAAAITTGITWTGGAAPTTLAAARYNWQRIGNVCFFDMRLEYDVAGSTLTGVDIGLPADMPIPAIDTEVDDDEWIGVINGLFSTNLAANSSAARTFLVRDASEATGYRVRSFATSGSFTSFACQGFYFCGNQ